MYGKPRGISRPNNYDVYAGDPPNIIRNGTTTTWINPNPAPPRYSIRFQPDKSESAAAYSEAFGNGVGIGADGKFSEANITPEQRARQAAFWNNAANYGDNGIIDGAAPPSVLAMSQVPAGPPKGRYIMAGTVPPDLKARFMMEQQAMDDRRAQAEQENALAVGNQDLALRDLEHQRAMAAAAQRNAEEKTAFERDQLRAAAQSRLIELLPAEEQKAAMEKLVQSLSVPTDISLRPEQGPPPAAAATPVIPAEEDESVPAGRGLLGSLWDWATEAVAAPVPLESVGPDVSRRNMLRVPVAQSPQVDPYDATVELFRRAMMREYPHTRTQQGDVIRRSNLTADPLLNYGG
jgi:hypothetical protein